MLTKIKAILGLSDTSKDILLNILIDSITDQILNYCHIDELPDGLQNVVVELVVKRYGLLGTEGLQSESYSGISYNYEIDWNETLTNQLKSYRRIRVVQ